MQSSTYLVEGVIITGYNRFAVQTEISTQVFDSRLLVRISDGQGFEPWVPVKAHTLSKRAHSTTLPPIQTTKC